MNNLSDIKHQHDIVAIIGQYVQLKKEGKEFVACCPFHSENSPSFKVNEQKQFYHCFGCGAHGDVIDFLKEFSGLEYVEACKQLGAEAEFIPLAKVAKNLNRAKYIPKFSLPVDDKRCPELCADMLRNATNDDSGLILNHTIDDNKWVSLVDWFGEVVNMFDGFDFLAGGISYGAFTPIKIKDSDNFMLCVDTKDAIDIVKKYKVNALICYTAHNLKYVYKTNINAKLLPVIRPTIKNDYITRAGDDDYLCYECNWLSYKDGVLTKEKIINV